MSESKEVNAKAELSYAIKGLVDLLNKKINEAEKLGLEVNISPPMKMGIKSLNDEDDRITVKIFRQINY